LNSEVKLFLVIVLTATAIISASLVITGHEGADNIPDAIRHSAFTVASLISTTGFSTLDFDIWPNIAQVILVMIMFMGACAGSTGGGFKVSRVIILIKGMAKEIGNLIHPRRVKKISVDGRPVSHEVIRSVNAYLVIYVVIFAASFIAISFDNYVLTSGDRLVTNFTAVTAAINNIGPGLDMVGPTSNFAHFSPFSKLVLIFDMLAGRLELLPMLLLFSPALWQSGAKKETNS
jgi:trk system potassium uptake protein TrkH